MCVMSAITPAIQNQWPHPAQLDYSTAAQIRDILRRIDELDRKLNTRQCEADAPKEKYLAQLSARIAALEAKELIGRI